LTIGAKEVPQEPGYRTFLDPRDDRFGAFGFVSELERQRLHVGDRAVTRIFDDFVIGVATEREP
jgi:hypothetical protein